LFDQLRTFAADLLERVRDRVSVQDCGKVGRAKNATQAYDVPSLRELGQDDDLSRSGWDVSREIDPQVMVFRYGYSEAVGTHRSSSKRIIS
jgi:predicted  nucleic acid-binding Zn ribbon protein